MSAIFVTGSGTDIGKTFITAALVRDLRARDIPARAFKPVASGFDPARPEGSDPAVLLAAMGEPVTLGTLDVVSPFRFAAPLAPDMAARLEGRTARLADVSAACARAIEAAPGPLLVEGVGGVMSPVAEDATGLDLMRALDLPALLVAGSYLGAISHALTAIVALRSAGVALAAVVVNESEASIGVAETATSITRFATGGAPPPIFAVARGGGKPDTLAAIARACGLA